MAEPARNYDYDSGEDDRAQSQTGRSSHLQSMPGGRTTKGKPALQKNDFSVVESPYDEKPSGDGRPHLRALESGKKNPESTSNVDTKPELRLLKGGDAAQEATSDVKSQQGNRFTHFFLGNNKRKAATFGAGLFGGGGIIALLMVLGISSGPFEFIHLAQLLTSPLTSFGHINATSDYRMGKMLLDIYRTGTLGDTDVGDTRVGFLAGTLKKPILEGLTEKGITIDFGSLKTFDGFTIDISNPKSPYYGKTQEEALSELQDTLGDTSKLSITFSPDVPNEIHVAGVGFNGDAAAIDAVSNFISIKVLNGPIASYIGSRFLMRYSAARTFHPLQKFLVQKAQDIVDWWTARNTAVEEGEQPATIDAANADQQTKTANGTENTPEVGETGPVEATQISSQLQGLHAGLGIAGGIATAVGIICLLQAVDHNIGAIRYAQVILPMMREAMDVITTGGQVMSGIDVNLSELQKMSSQFASVDANTHKVTSTWNDAAPFVDMAGGAGGIDLDQGMKDIFAGAPAWLSWTQNSAVQTLCTNTAQFVAGAISIVVGVFSGEVVSTVIGLVASQIAGPTVINFVSNLLAGSAINPSTLAGAQWGNVVAYGAQLAGNAQALQYGGVALTSQQVAELDRSDMATSQAQFQGETLADRTLNPSDYRTIVGSAIDQLNLAGGPQSILADITNLPGLFSSLLRMPASLISATAGAAATTYQYPFPEFGFSQADLNNSAVQDPLQNAQDVGAILDKNNTNGEPDYINMALDCFGVSITKGSEGWDVVPTTNTPGDQGFGQDRTEGVDAYDASTYDQSSCIHNSDTNWLKVRFWIMDTRTMEGYACYMGDQESCNDNTFNGVASTASNPTGAGAGGDSSCMTTNGAGSFTDATTPIPANLPNKLPLSIQQMCQRAQTLANQSGTGAAAAIASHASLFAQWCNGSNAGTGIVLGSGDCSTSGQCDYTASFIWGYRNSGYGFATNNSNTPIFGTSYHWNSILATYPQFAHPNDTHPPVGALLFYNNSIYSGPGGGGHVTVYLGNNWVVTSDMSGTADGKGSNHPGQVAIVHASAITNGTWGETYLGWADPIIMGTPAP